MGLLGFLGVRAQAPHLYEYTYPVVSEENPSIRALMDKVSADSIEATIEHLQSYYTRRYDTSNGRADITVPARCNARFVMGAARGCGDCRAGTVGPACADAAGRLSQGAESQRGIVP